MVITHTSTQQLTDACLQVTGSLTSGALPAKGASRGAAGVQPSSSHASCLRMVLLLPTARCLQVRSRHNPVAKRCCHAGTR